MSLQRFSDLSPRNLLSRPQRSLLTTIGIILGVGIVLGVLTLSDTMSGSFKNLFNRVYGSADLTVTSGGADFDTGILQRVQSTPGVASAAPRLAVPASLVLKPGTDTRPPTVQNLRIFGIEPGSAALATGFELVSGRLPERGAEIALDVNTANANNLKPGDRLQLATSEGPSEVTLTGLLQVPGGAFGGTTFALAPLSYVQSSFGKPGKLSSIMVQATSESEIPNLQQKLRQELGNGFEVDSSATRSQQVAGQFQGFKIALLFFAGTALFVGAFLVFNALSMTVLERTRELGMLRALGATRAMIARSVILEAGILGLVGSTLGLALGYGMAWGLVYLLSKAFNITITSLTISLFTLVSALVVGIVITILAALYPALRAGSVTPVEAMRQLEKRRRGIVSRWSWVLGVVLVGVGAPWTYYLAKNLSASLDTFTYLSGIAGIIATFLGVSLIVPLLIQPLAAVFTPALRAFLGIEGKMAALNATRNRGRTALTASALMVGVSLVIAFSALGQSILGSIQQGVEASLGSDFIVQPTTPGAHATFSSNLIQQVDKIPGVQTTTGIASTFLGRGPEGMLLLGVDKNFPQIFRLNYQSGPPDAFAQLEQGPNVLIGQKFADSHKLSVGSQLELPGPTGNKQYRVAGILKEDFIGGGTGVYLSKKNIAQDFNVTQDGFLAIKAQPGSDRVVMERDLRQILNAYPQFTVYSNAEWKSQIESDFNRQWMFFYAIMGVAVAVSAFGVINTLSMSVFERTREIGILRAVGTTRLQIGRLIIDEGIVISVIGSILGVAVGSGLGYLFVRGSSAGGFSVAFHYPFLYALYALLAGLFIGIFAGLLPARTAARTNIVEAVQYE